MSIYKTLATVANPNISKEEFDNIKRLIKSNIEESKKDLIDVADSILTASLRKVNNLKQINGIKSTEEEINEKEDL